jgi:hypothetical protein
MRTSGCQQVLDQPEERLERRRVSVDEAHAEQIEVYRVRQMTRGEQLGGTEVQQRRTRGIALERCRQFARTDQKMGVDVALRSFHQQIRTISRAGCGVIPALHKT